MMYNKLFWLIRLFVLSILAMPVMADSGQTFYFALPGNALGRNTGSSQEDNFNSVYHLVIERAFDSSGDEETSVAPEVTLQYLHGGRVYTYQYWNSDGSAGTVFEDVAVDYGDPLAIELETFFDPDGPNGIGGENIDPILVATDDNLEGGVQEGVFRVVVTNETQARVRLLLMNIDGPYIRPSAVTSSETPSPKFSDGQTAPDVTRLFPVNNLGNEYTLNIDIPDRRVLNSQPKASVTVIATRNGTELDFEASYSMLNNQGHPVRTPTSVTLDRGQMWTMSAEQYDLLLVSNYDDPLNPIEPYYIDSGLNLYNGMKIRASKPVAVITAGGCASNRVSACDQTLLQLLPDRLLGTEYHVPAMTQGLSDGFDLRIVAADYVEDLKIHIQFPDGSYVSTNHYVVDGQSGWSSGQMVYTLATSAEPMLDGQVWDVVWSPLPWLGRPNSTAERPGIDADNRRLTLGVLPYVPGDEFFEIWYDDLSDDSSVPVMPNGSILVQPNGADLRSGMMPAQVTVSASAPVSITVSPRTWSPAVSPNFELSDPGAGLSNGIGRAHATISSPTGGEAPEGPGEPPAHNDNEPCVHWWDGYCELGLQQSGTGEFWALPAISTNHFAFHVAGQYPDPAQFQLVPTDLYQGHVGISLPMSMATSYIGDPENYMFFNDKVCGSNVPMAHQVLLVVHKDFLNENTNLQLMMKRRFGSNSLGYTDDSQWVPLTDRWSDSVRSNPRGYFFDFVDWDFASNPEESFCLESYFNNGLFWGYPPDSVTVPVEFQRYGNSRDWRPMPNPSGGASEYYYSYLRLIPFRGEDINDLLWDASNPASRWDAISNPYTDDDDDGFTDGVEPGDLVPDIPVVTYQFAVGTDSGGGYVVDSSSNGLMVYPVGTGWYATYGYIGGIPAEDLPADELILVDQIPLAPGNSIVDSSIKIVTDGVTTDLVEGIDYELLEANGGESVRLYLKNLYGGGTGSGQYQLPSSWSTAELVYELELRDLVTGTERLVGERTVLEAYTHSPMTGLASSSTMERGPTSVSVVDGPVALTLSTVGDQVEYISPLQDIQPHATLGIDTGDGLQRHILGSLPEFLDTQNLISGVEVIEGDEGGHDELRTSTLMLERSTGSPVSPFVSSGSISYIVDAGRQVEWNNVTLVESPLQPEGPGGSVALDPGTQLLKVEVRTALNVAQIESWRANPVGAPPFVEIGQADGVPDLVGAADSVLDIVGTGGEEVYDSRVIEVRVTLTSFDPAGDNNSVSPVLESVITSYTPSALVLSLDIIDVSGAVAYSLSEFPVDLSIIGDTDNPTDYFDALLAGDLIPGEYMARARVIDESIAEVLQTATHPLSIVVGDDVSDMLASRVQTDQNSYAFNEVVSIQSIVENIAPAPWGSEFRVEVSVYPNPNGVDYCTVDPGSTSAVFDAPPYWVYSLEPGQADDRSFTWSPSNLEFTDPSTPEQFTVVQRLYSSGASSEAFACTTTDFEIRPSSVDGLGLDGELSLSASYLPTDTGENQVEIVYSITNVGSVDLTNAQFAIYVELAGTSQDDSILCDDLVESGPFGVQAISSGMIDWDPGAISPGTWLIHLYARAEEITPSALSCNPSSPDYSGWIELDIAAVVVEGVVVVEQPWYVAIELNPTGSGTESLSGYTSSNLSFNGGINARGSVVGSSLLGADWESSVWLDCQNASDLHNQLPILLPQSSIGAVSFATDVSDDGIIVGAFQQAGTSSYSAFVYSEFSGAVELLTIGSNAETFATAVNSNGSQSSVVGWTTDDNQVSTKGLIWRDALNAQPPLEISGENASSAQILDINNAGIAVGYSLSGGVRKALWVDAENNVFYSDVGTDSPFVSLSAVSDEGPRLGEYYVSGTYYDSLTGRLRAFQSVINSQGSLSTFVPLDQNQNSNTIPNSITSDRTTVGVSSPPGLPSAGYFWSFATGYYDLSDLVLNDDDSGMDWEISRANDIDESTQWISANASLNGQQRAVRLERVPFAPDLLDALHLWVRADAGVDQISGDVTVWRDLVFGLDVADPDPANNFVLSTSSPSYFQDDCCEAPIILFDSPSEGLGASGIVDDDGTALSGDATFAIVFVPKAIASGGTTVEVARVGTGVSTSPLVISYTSGGLIEATYSDSALSLMLGSFKWDEPVLLIVRQDSVANSVEIWRDQEPARAFTGFTSLDNWSEIELGGSTAADDEFGVAEVMLFETALDSAQIAQVGRELRTRHAVANPVSSDSAVFWIRSDRGVIPPTGGITDWIWEDQVGTWGNLAQEDSVNAPQLVPSRFGTCLDSVYFDGDDFFDGVGSLDVVVVLDHSGSMDNQVGGEDKFVLARSSANEFVAGDTQRPGLLSDGNPVGHRVSMVSFDGLSGRQARLINGSVFSSIQSEVTSELGLWCSVAGSGDIWTDEPGSPNAFTHIPAALESATDILLGTSNQSTSPRKAVVFLSDGEPNFNSDSTWSETELFGPVATNPYSMAEDLQLLKVNHVPVHTIGFDLGSNPGSAGDMAAGAVLSRMTADAGTGGIHQDASTGDGLSDAFLELVSSLSAVVNETTISLTFSADEVPTGTELPRVLLQTGILENNGDVLANGMNVRLHNGRLKVGVWWVSDSGEVLFNSISTPYEPEMGLSQLVIGVKSINAGLQLSAYINGVPFTSSGGSGIGGQGSATSDFGNVGGDVSTNGGWQGSQGIGGADRIDIWNDTLVMANMTVGGSAYIPAGLSHPVVRTYNGLVETGGFIGDVVELLVYDERLEGQQLEDLFDWGIEQYGAGTLTRGYYPTAIAVSGGVGDQGYFDSNYDGFETVLLDATRTYDPDDSSESLLYEWYENDALIATGRTASVELPRGRHRITLRVEDGAGHVSIDDVVIDIHRVYTNIKPVGIPFDHGPLSAAGDPLPLSIPISDDSTKMAYVRGAVPTYETGRKASSVNFDGKSMLDLAEAVNEIPSGTSPRTYSVWFEAGQTSHDEPTLFVQADDQNSRVFSITGNRRRVAYAVNGYTRGVEWTDPNDYLPIGWHHLVVVVQRGAVWADQVIVYLNGQELQTRPLDSSGGAGLLDTGSDQIFIGGNPIGSSETVYQGGRIDEMQIYAGALTPSEVSDLYNDVPVAAWAFETESDHYAYASTAIVPTDLSTFIMSSEVYINETGRMSLAKKGSATTAGAVFAAPTKNWTMMFKIRPTDLTTDLDPLISDTTGAILMLHKDEVSQVPMLYVATTGNSLPAPNLFDGDEHWITIISRDNYPGVSNGTFIFVDDQFDFTLPVSATSTVIDGGAITIAGPNDNDGGFEGEIDDFSIYGRPLTESECLEAVE